MDEVWSFVGHKKHKRWLLYAYAPETDATVMVQWPLSAVRAHEQRSRSSLRCCLHRHPSLLHRRVAGISRGDSRRKASHRQGIDQEH